MRPLQIAVIGAGTADEADLDLARVVGRTIAEHGATLVCGGLGGVMAAAAAGAADVQGVVLGLLPGDDPEDAASGVSVVVPTGMGEIRNALVIRAADAVVALAGSHGTLSELALAGRAGVPVVLLTDWAAGHGEMRIPLGQTVTDPTDAVSTALRLARARRTTQRRTAEPS